MLDDLEYTFFTEALAHKFVAYCEQMALQTKVAFEETFTGESSFNVAVTSAMTDEQANLVEEYYSEMLFGEQAAEIEGNDEEGALADVCGVQVQLASGSFTTVAIEPKIMNKILSVLSVDELQSFLAQVAEDIENPKDGPICCRK